MRFYIVKYIWDSQCASWPALPKNDEKADEYGAKSKAKVAWRVTWLEVTAAVCRTGIVRRETDTGGTGDLISVGQGAQVQSSRREWRILVTRLARWIYQRTPTNIDVCYLERTIARICFINELLLPKWSKSQ